MEVERELRAVFDSAGARGFVHVCDVGGAAEVGLDGDELVVTASVFKVAVMLELARQAVTGEVDLAQRVRVPAGRRTMGPTGLSVMRDDVEVSVRDLAYLMMSVSDNTATDVIMEMVGNDRIGSTLDSLGVRETVVAEDCAALLDGLLTDLGRSADNPDLSSVAPEVFDAARALTPGMTNRTTPRDMTRLLSMIWRDEAGAPEACAEVRRIMALQVWPHRLSSGFPDGVVVAGKTGTLPGIRNEVGVVVFADGSRYAEAVFTRARSYAFQQPAIDAAIGAAARLAVESLRG